MARRSERDATVSFFALQDVMLGVIGVVILITILFLLLRATTEIGIPQPPIPLGSLEMEDRPNVRTVVELREASASTRARQRAEILEVQSELDRTDAEIDSLQRELRLLLDDQALSGDAVRLSRLVEQLAGLESRLGEVQKRNRLTYLMSDPDQLSPLVAELSSNRVVISREDGRSSPFAIRAVSVAETAQRAVDFLLAERRSDEYLLLVVKPSGLPLWSMIAGDPRIQGLPVGLDLIPEQSATTDQFPGGGP